MRQWIALSVIAVLLVTGSTYAGESGESYHWTPAEMSTRPASRSGQLMRKIAAVRLLPDDIAMPKDIDCHDDPCRFDLYYFFGKGFNLARPARKNILFIAGGPGQLVDNVSQMARMVGHLEAHHNVVYFDLRGGGRSVIPASNKFDRFLRGEYVADDIERIRKAVLNHKPWDAIYSHSWGALPAQLYAARFGSNKVKTLILSAPVVRDRDTHGARARMTAANLKLILTTYRSPPGQPCDCRDRKLPVAVQTFLGTATEKLGEVSALVDARASYNFCFIDVEQANWLGDSLEKLLSEIEARFGSVDFVTDHYDQLLKSGDAGSRPRFPREFYSAIKTLQFTGAPESGVKPYAGDFARQIDAALVIGHYLTLALESASGSATVTRRCAASSPFLKNAQCATGYCKIIAPAKLAGQRDGQLESIRANRVLGLYDGVARALVRPGMIERDSSDCFTGKDVTEFAAGSDGKELLRGEAKKLGAIAAEKICPWTPKNHPHKVRTLILKGARDTVIAGCQAEDFYRDGLKGERALLEFRGTGHAMYAASFNFIGDRTVYAESLRVVLERFMDLPVARLRTDKLVTGNIDKLQAIFREPDAGRADCPV
ncbi:MAG: alpha/beta fold hydrolase [Candidatus Binatia bacterium]